MLIRIMRHSVLSPYESGDPCRELALPGGCALNAAVSTLEPATNRAGDKLVLHRPSEIPAYFLQPTPQHAHLFTRTSKQVNSFKHWRRQYGSVKLQRREGINLKEPRKAKVDSRKVNKDHGTYAPTQPNPATTTKFMDIDSACAKRDSYFADRTLSSSPLLPSPL